MGEISHGEELADPGLERLRREINREMIGCFADLFHLQAALNQTSSRLQKSPDISPKEIERRVLSRIQVLDRLDQWSQALRKRAYKVLETIEKPQPPPPTLPIIPSPPPIKRKKILEYLSRIFRL